MVQDHLGLMNDTLSQLQLLNHGVQHGLGHTANLRRLDKMPVFFKRHNVFQLLQGYSYRFY
nr:hypothetical protein [uncultured Prevotella sp.]